MAKKYTFNGDITNRFLKFTGGNGNPVIPAIPRTEAEIQLYGRLKGAGVDMNRISIEDIRKALKLREE